jgi:hypothetical protein
MQEAELRLARAAYDRQVVQDAGGGGGDFGLAGPPTWDRASWEAFKMQFGRKPFGPQPDGTFLPPPSTTNMPDWAYEEIWPNASARKPPVGWSPENI